MYFNATNILLSSFIVLIASKWGADLASHSWDWDINHMMYFGQRLFFGEFQWTQEFDDKLPVLQIIFALPAAFDSMTLWLAISLTSILGGSLAVSYVTVNILERGTRLPVGERRAAGLCAAVACVYMFTYNAGGIHHVNPTAASAAIISIALLMYAGCPPKAGAWSVGLFILSAAVASVAIGVRPYFLLSIVAAAIWLALRDRPEATRWSVSVLIAAIWIGMVGLFGLLVNALPYVLKGQVEVLAAGLSMLSQDLHYQNLLDLLLLFWSSFFGSFRFLNLVMITLAVAAGLIAASGVFAGGYSDSSERSQAKRRLSYDTLMVVFALPALIVLMILLKHFYPHYLQMLSPFFAIGFGVFCGLYFRFIKRFVSADIEHPSKILAMAVVIIFVVPQATFNAAMFFRNGLSLESPNDRMVAEFAQYLETRPAEKRDFLALDSMYLHWRLREPRHGFPHAANTLHIALGWWDGAKLPELFDLPANGPAYCEKLRKSGPSVVVWHGRAPLQVCFESKRAYAAVDVEMPNGERVYERR